MPEHAVERTDAWWGDHVKVSTYLEDSLYRRLRHAVIDLGQTQIRFVHDAVEEKLNKIQAEKSKSAEAP